MPAVSRTATMIDHALAGAAGHALPIRIGATLFVTLLTAASSQVSVPLPFTPVPFTLQPMVVLLGAAVLGPELGLLSQVLYLAAGAAGLPVFAFAPDLPQGVLRLLGPTGGYLLSYPLAAFVTGWLARRGFDRRYFTSVLAMAAGLAVVFAGGVAWLTLFAPGSDARSLQSALAAGFYPFVAADLFKVCVAGAVMPAAWRLLGSPRA